MANSNTLEACEELERLYWRYKKNIIIYPDASGGNRQSSRGESDLDVFRDSGFERIKHKRKNPNVSDRLNSVNRMMMSADGAVRFKVNKTCKHAIRAFEQVIYKPGTREVFKEENIEHIADGIGYCLHYEFPTRKIEYSGINL